MIIAENQIRVPGKMYKVRVKCVSTRRLTTVEWIILNCTKKFHDSESMADKTLKYAFEEVFQLQNSELLIKPCLTNLKNIKVIYIKENDKFDYDHLTFSDIEITETGVHMLEEGLIPGEQTELPIDIYYNPLTGKMSHFDRSNVGTDDVIDFGTARDYNNEFPAEHVKEELQSGMVGGGRFIASKYRIQEIDPLISTNWDAVITMTAVIDDADNISTNPPIIEANVKTEISKLFHTKEVNKTITAKLSEITNSNVANIIGSGRNIKRSILDVAKNGKFIFMETGIYNLFKRNTSVFKDKIVILFGETKSLSISKDKTTLIHIPFKFPIEECAVLNENGLHVCLGKKICTYEDHRVEIPIVYEDNQLIKKKSIVVDWLSDIIHSNYKNNIKYVGLYSLPFMGSEGKEFIGTLYNEWKSKSAVQIVSDIKTVNDTCVLLGTNVFSLDFNKLKLVDKLDFNNYTQAVGVIEEFIMSGCIELGSKEHQCLVREFVKHISKPKLYNELIDLLQRLEIKSHDLALLFDDIVGELYSKDILEDIIIAIAARKFEKIPELFEYDVFFNEYKNCLDSIELHISGLDLFTACNDEQLRTSIKSCPDIASLQSYVAELSSKNRQLLERHINIYDLLRNKKPECADAFMKNIRCIDKYVSSTLESAYEELDIQEASEDNSNKKIYILDTCALIKNPDIFLFFAEDEYVRIPTKVVDELGKIKDKRNSKYGSDVSHTARKVSRDINDVHLIQFNQSNKIRFLIENADLSLLPPDLDPSVPDNQILSVALKYKGWDTCIVSDDGVFNLTAKAQNIKAMKGAQFKKEHESYYKSAEQRQKEFLLAKERDTFNKMLKDSTSATDEVSEDKKIDVAIDNIAIRKIKLYVPEIDDKVISYLETNKIKTIGAFRQLTESKVDMLPAKGPNVITRNSLKRHVKDMDYIIEKVVKKIFE